MSRLFLFKGLLIGMAEIALSGKEGVGNGKELLPN